MLFQSETKWWGDKGPRGNKHNGLDLRFYEATDGTIETIAKGLKIPIIYDGRMVNIIKDFLGYSMFAAHEVYHEDSQLFTIYGHVQPSADVSIGKSLREGTEIAALAGRSHNVPSHLHISIVLIPMELSGKVLTWKAVDEDKSIRFLDPLQII